MAKLKRRVIVTTVRYEETEELTEQQIQNWKSENLKIIETRMSGWQLTTFKDSYKHKQSFGISLFKKDQQNKL